MGIGLLTGCLDSLLEDEKAIDFLGTILTKLGVRARRKKMEVLSELRN